ncbi:hypothetical protein [Clostridium sp. Marseille-QA1073]
MIPGIVKIAACKNNTVASVMIEEIKLLQGVVGLNKDRIAKEKLVRKLLELNGTETRGVVTIMQRILISKGHLSSGSDTGVIGQANKDAIGRFKATVGISNSSILVDILTWRKLLEY